MSRNDFLEFLRLVASYIGVRLYRYKNKFLCEFVSRVILRILIFRLKSLYQIWESINSDKSYIFRVYLFPIYESTV